MYGLTESFRSTFLDPKKASEKPASIGKAIPDVEIFILDDEGNECKPGEIGELVHVGGVISGVTGKTQMPRPKRLENFLCQMADCCQVSFREILSRQMLTETCILLEG